MTTLELEIIKETPTKRITLVRELDKRNIYIKKELRNYNKELWYKLQQINIRGIPRIYSIQENDGWLEIIEEYIVSETLYDYLNHHGKFSSEEAFQIINQLCDILAVLHQQTPKIIHRDIKPKNIFYDGKQVYLFDFDIAREYEEGQKRDTVYLGSKGYASPEQFGFLQTDERSDIYSLGVLYHVLLTCQLPQESEYHGYEELLIKKMIAMDPQARYQTIKEVQTKLNHLHQHHLPQENKEEKRCYTLPGFRSHKPWKMIIALICYILIAYVIVEFDVVDPMTPYDGILYRLMLIAMSIITISFATNYLSIWKYVPGIHVQNRFLRMLMIILPWLVMMFIIFILAVIIFTILM